LLTQLREDERQSRFLASRRINVRYQPMINRHTGSLMDGRSTSFTIEHRLGSQDVVCAIFENKTGDEILTSVRVLDNNTVQVSFSEPPTQNQFRIVIIG
jgi:hypothetical protein